MPTPQEKLQDELLNKECILHRQKPSVSVNTDGKIRIDTCCYLFKAQLYLFVDEHNSNKYVALS